VGSAGFAGMLLEGALLLAYQARRGALFQDLGLLLTCFMGGLCLGAWGMGCEWRRKGSGLAIALCTSSLGAGCAWAVQTGGGGPDGTGLLAAWCLRGCGVCWAGDRGQANLPDPSDPLRGGPHAADLWGGCLAPFWELVFLPFGASQRRSCLTRGARHAPPRPGRSTLSALEVLWVPGPGGRREARGGLRFSRVPHRAQALARSASR
jgi:hypothetical protein